MGEALIYIIVSIAEPLLLIVVELAYFFLPTHHQTQSNSKFGIRFAFVCWGVVLGCLINLILPFHLINDPYLRLSNLFVMPVVVAYVAHFFAQNPNDREADGKIFGFWEAYLFALTFSLMRLASINFTFLTSLRGY